MACTMNTDTYEALQATGLSDAQAKLIATAIPDLEPLRMELRGELRELRSEMDHRFAEVDAGFARLRGEMQQGFTEMDAKFAALRVALEHRLNAQTWAIVGVLVTIGGLLTATNLLA